MLFGMIGYVEADFHSTPTKGSIIPDWVQITTGYWKDGIISDTEYRDAVWYLIEHEIIKISITAIETVPTLNEIPIPPDIPKKIPLPEIPPIDIFELKNLLDQHLDISSNIQDFNRIIQCSDCPPQIYFVYAPYLKEDFRNEPLTIYIKPNDLYFDYFYDDAPKAIQFTFCSDMYPCVVNECISVPNSNDIENELCAYPIYATGEGITLTATLETWNGSEFPVYVYKNDDPFGNEGGVKLIEEEGEIRAYFIYELDELFNEFRSATWTEDIFSGDFEIEIAESPEYKKAVVSDTALVHSFVVEFSKDSFNVNEMVIISAYSNFFNKDSSIKDTIELLLWSQNYLDWLQISLKETSVNSGEFEKSICGGRLTSGGVINLNIDIDEFGYTTNLQVTVNNPENFKIQRSQTIDGVGKVGFNHERYYPDTNLFLRFIGESNTIYTMPNELPEIPVELDFCGEKTETIKMKDKETKSGVSPIPDYTVSNRCKDVGMYFPDINKDTMVFATITVPPPNIIIIGDLLMDTSFVYKIAVPIDYSDYQYSPYTECETYDYKKKGDAIRQFLGFDVENPWYGEYCGVGWGNEPKSAWDTYDNACRIHDECIGEHGGLACSCNRLGVDDMQYSIDHYTIYDYYQADPDLAYYGSRDDKILLGNLEFWRCAGG